MHGFDIRGTIGGELPSLLPRLRRYALALCQSSAGADDLVQSACERALTKPGLWTPGTRLDAWLFRIMRNIWIDGIRRARVEAEVLEEHPAEELQDGEREALGRIEFGEVTEIIQDLPWEQREVLLLVCVDDMSYREVAEVLGVPVGTVMSRLARARKRLLNAYENSTGERARI